MNLKTFGFRAAVAVTAVAGSTLAVSSAEAAVLTGSVQFELPASQVQSVSANGVDFNNTSFAALGFVGTGSFAGFNQITIQDLLFAPALVPGVPSINVSIPSFISLSNGSQTIAFNLTRLLNPSFSPATGNNNGVFFANLQGTFSPGGQANDPSGPNFLFAFRPSIGGSTGSIQLTPIPTPALLPGLLALGAGVMRKRKAEAEEAAEA